MASAAAFAEVGVEGAAEAGEVVTAGDFPDAATADAATATDAKNSLRFTMITTPFALTSISIL